MYSRLVAYASLLTVISLGLCVFFIIPGVGIFTIGYFVPVAIALVVLAVILMRRKS